MHQKNQQINDGHHHGLVIPRKPALPGSFGGTIPFPGARGLGTSPGRRNPLILDLDWEEGSWWCQSSRSREKMGLIYPSAISHHWDLKSKPGSAQKLSGCGTWGRGLLVGLALLGEDLGGFFQPQGFHGPTLLPSVGITSSVTGGWSLLTCIVPP